MANGLFQHSQGQRPWNVTNPPTRLANGHIQRYDERRHDRLNMAVGQTERGWIPGPGAMPQATMKIAVGEREPWPTAFRNIARGNAPGT